MAPRKTAGLARRRVRADEDEADVGGEAEVGEDSQSDDSALSEEEDDDDDNESDASLSDEEVPETEEAKLNGKAKHIGGSAPPLATAGAGKDDTHAMLNGVKGDDAASEVDFEDMEDGEDVKATASRKKERKRRGKAVEAEQAEPVNDATDGAGPDVNRPETLFERRKREHEEYRKKRDADPAFVPNRGAFFMHDSRSGGGGANGFRPFGRGRGRGGPVFGSVAPEPAETNWKHDMHDTVAAAERERERLREIRERTNQMNRPNSDGNFTHPQRGANRSAPPRTFNATVTKGTVPIRVFLPGMKAPKVVSDFAVKTYTRLPIHRPPLRRDKPVRISFPDSQPRYVYPAQDRSFVFIPRQMRPGGTGFARGGIVGGGLGPNPPRGRGSFSGHYRDSTYGGSTYGSAYAGSNYAQSNGISRRSSVAQDVIRPSVEQPYNPNMQNTQSQPRALPKPIVRLPSGPAVPPEANGTDGEETAASEDTGVLPTSNSQAIFKAALEQQSSSNNIIPMHQPRPQKSVSIENIESPAGLAYTQYPPVHEFPMVPFYNQHSRASSYPSQPSSTPHSQIPEQSVHARPFHPTFTAGPPNGFYMYGPHHPQMFPTHPQPHPHHNGPPPPYVPSPNAMPYVPNMQPSPLMPMQPSPMMPMQPSPMMPMQPSPMMPMQPSPMMPMQPSPMMPMQQPPPPPAANGAPPTMIAQESNGMVYYIDANQYFAQYGTYPPGPAPFTPAQENGPSPMMYYPQMMPMPMMATGQMAGNGQHLYYMP